MFVLRVPADENEDIALEPIDEMNELWEFAKNWIALNGIVANVPFTYWVDAPLSPLAALPANVNRRAQFILRRLNVPTYTLWGDVIFGGAHGEDVPAIILSTLGALSRERVDSEGSN